MKRLLIVPALSLSLLFAPNVSAQTADVNAGAQFGVQATPQQIMESRKELEKYIRIRQRRDAKEKTLGHEGKSVEVARHKFSLFRRDVDQRQTTLRRTGEFTSIPDYAERRSFSNLSIQAPNNPKRNFRVRATDYYVEGGEAGRDVLLENVRFGTDPALRNANNLDKLLARRGAARAINELRDEQKAARGTVSNSTNYKPFSERIGSASKSFNHPFQNFPE